MKKYSDNSTRVELHAGDGATEISVVDHAFNKLKSGFGSLEAKLFPGIYKIRWKTGSAEDTQLIEVTGEEPEGVLRLDGPEQKISSPVPLLKTRLGAGSQAEFLRALSLGDSDASYGDSQVLVFLQDSEADEDGFQVDSVTVREPDGTPLFSLMENRAIKNTYQAGNMQTVEPGVCRIRVDTGPLGDYEMFVPAVPNWQTRVFLKCDKFYSGDWTGRRPSLRGASVLLAKLGTPFDPESRDAHLAEIALNALARGHDISESDDMRGLLAGKFDDPMLGLFAAHVLLQRRRYKKSLLETVCHNLVDLVGMIPDVQALFAYALETTPKHESLATFAGYPPMLVRSWGLMVQRSKKQFGMIPAGSLADRIAASVAATHPWLLSRVANQTTKVLPMVSHAAGERIIGNILQNMAKIGPTIVAELQNDSSYLDLEEIAILDVVNTCQGIPTLNVGQPGVKIGETAGKLDVSQPASVKIATDAVNNLPLPAYSIARSAVSLQDKLADHFGAAGFQRFGLDTDTFEKA